MFKYALPALALGFSAFTFQGCLEHAASAPDQDAAAALVAQPDLIITQAAIWTNSPTQTLFLYTLKNQGTAAIADIHNIVIQCKWSANSVYGDAGDVAAGQAVIGLHQALAAGASTTLSFTATGAIPAGKSILLAKIDATNLIAESSEGNNVKSMLARPNLRIKTAAITSYTGSRINYSYTIENKGSLALADIHDVVLQNFWSAAVTSDIDAGKAAGGAIIGKHQALAVGATYSGTFWSSGIAPDGMNYLNLLLYPPAGVAETNAGDNAYALSLANAPKPDLVFTAGSTVRSGSGVTFTFTLKNNGTLPIDDIHDLSIQHYYSSNTVFGDAGDVAAGGWPIYAHAALPVGGTYTGTRTVSTAVPAGMGYLVSQIDAGKAVAETNESNNTRAAAIP